MATPFRVLLSLGFITASVVVWVWAHSQPAPLIRPLAIAAAAILVVPVWLLMRFPRTQRDPVNMPNDLVEEAIERGDTEPPPGQD